MRGTILKFLLSSCPDICNTSTSMYSLRTFTSPVSSSALSWAHRADGWNMSSSSTSTGWDMSSFPTSNSSVPWLTAPSEASTIIEVTISTRNETFFDPPNVTVSSGAILRFHHLNESCGLVRSFSDICVNTSTEGIQEKLHLLKTVNMNGSTFLDYLVDSTVPQWLYPLHSAPGSLCRAGTVFTIMPSNSSDTAGNRTTHSTTPFDLPTSTSHAHAHGACDSPLMTATTVTGDLTSVTDIRTVASASQTSQQPFATSFTPELSNHGRKIIAHRRFVMVSILLLSHVLVMLTHR